MARLSSMPWSIARLERLREADKPCNDERTLMWRAVIWQALHDFLYIPPDYPAGCTETEYSRNLLFAAKIKARNWLLGKGRDFVDVCIYADIDPDKVRAVGVEILEGKKTNIGNLSFTDLIREPDIVGGRH